MGSKFELTVGPADTVAAVKDRVAGMQMIPFPDQELLMNGKALPDNSKLAQCGVREGSAMELVVQATEARLVEQLIELLQARDMSADELGLLYCYKYGCAVTQALKMLGVDGQFADFLKEQKKFLVEGGRVTLVREDTNLKPFSVIDEVSHLLKANGGTMEIKDLCFKFTQKFNVNISSLMGTRPSDFLAKEKDLFVLNGRGAVTLKSTVNEQEAPPAPKETASTTQFIRVPPGLADDATVSEPWSPSNDQYLELHDRICSRPFNSKVVQALDDVVDLVTEHIFLAVDHAVKGGSVGKGTAIVEHADAEVVFFLDGLPARWHDQLLSPMLKSVASILQEHLVGKDGIVSVNILDDYVQVHTKDISADLHFSPVFESYTETIQTMREQAPDAWRFYSPALIKERVQFISRQPAQVKLTMRLLKWWRDQQQWSSKIAFPKDDILEFMAVYSAVQTKPLDQCAAIANVMSLLSRFNEMRIVWSNYYRKEDVWAPLLRQRPLLMDPTNPFVNVADPQAFDASELMELARTTHFFW